MPTCRSQPIIRAQWFILAATAATLGFMEMSAAEQAQAPLQSLQRRGAIYLNMAAPPDTIPAAQPDWDVFAWNTFIALNWPALEVVPNRARGVPDLSKEFATAANSDLGVWETFKEKREIFNFPGTAGKLVWQSPIDYGPLRQGGVSVNSRVFHQNSGTSTPPNALDETVEVQSQALEKTYPDGKTPNPPFKASPPAVTPRVWFGPPSAKNPIVYEVKLNYDYFNYVVANGLNVDNTDTKNGSVAMKAAKAEIRLPVRTSSANLSPSNQPANTRNPAVLNYRAAGAISQFRRINYLYNSGFNGPLPALPAEGSIQVKAAWLKLGGSDAKPSQFPKWHTAIAVNYITGPDGKPMASEPTLFGLVGMHIIQRIHTTTPDPVNPSQPQSPNNANPAGATFVFATWEHDSIFKSPAAGQKNPKPTYFYSNFFAGENLEHGLKKGFYPPLDQAAYPVVRKFPVLANTMKVNTIVHNLIKAKNPNSVWLNYNLVGTQFQAVNLDTPIPDGLVSPPNDPTRIGQPAFLANLAIETNLGLQFFKGQPPFLSVIGNFLKNAQNPTNPLSNNNTGGFARDNFNTAFNGNGYNMGGCMGCHGVAQSKGFGFSFVLLDGYLGAVTDTQEHFDQPGANPSP